MHSYALNKVGSCSRFRALVGVRTLDNGIQPVVGEMHSYALDTVGEVLGPE